MTQEHHAAFSGEFLLAGEIFTGSTGVLSQLDPLK